MNDSILQQTLHRIRPTDKTVSDAVTAHLNDLTKPPGSLGRLESLATQYALITGAPELSLPRKRIYTFAADHGVTEENVSAYPKEVTGQMVLNMASGGAAINVLGRHAGAEVFVVDIGVDGDLTDADNVITRKIRKGTANMATGPAMRKSEAVKAVEVGIQLATEAVQDGVTLIGIGEMGIGNSTAAAAIIHTLLPCSVNDIVGRGTGVDDDGMKRKAQVIVKAVSNNRPDADDAMDVLSKVGGLEIAGMTGVILGTAAAGVGVVVDGFIATSAALVALRLCEDVHDYLFFSHCSAEQGHGVCLEQLNIHPILDLGLRLGEGTGAALAMNLIDAAVKIYNEMATFSGAGVSGKQ
ncbi:MAG: nicotinate-nucleotide--dimethylbenzimidazole phosphoribosyltransferase [Deltaproteobacteria bacterium]|nr:nicotinate-nucleotide--dimethylbenzimidazole phosphoribosyltransferase [Deltaproteobacteria bacterium]MBN2674511.1 nicotinate-nucleotide--dimethylbenzimidazole phosphoribosyltransferase [Deltaproteobacteria bacterium]